MELRRIEVDGEVVDEPHEVAREHRVRAVRLELLPEPLLRDAVEMRVQRVEVAVLVQELRGRLRTDRGHAGDVVRGVAHQREQIAHLTRRHAHLLGRLGLTEDLVAHGVPHEHVLPVDELQEVLVGAHDDHAQPLGARAPHDRRDEVVGLDALLRVERDRVRVDDVLEPRHLRNELGRRGRARRLVRRVHAVARRRTAPVERDGEQARLLLLHELEQHRDDAVDRVRRLAARGRERRDRVKRAEDVAAEIDDVERAIVACRRKRCHAGRTNTAP